MTGNLRLGRGSTWRRTVTSAGAVAIVASLAAGCGSSDDTSSTAGSAAEPAGGGAASKFVAEASKPVATWDGFGAPIKPPAGKKIVAIECSSLGVGCVQGAEATKEAAAKIGWTADIVNGKGDPTVWNTAIQNAVAAKADGIALFAISPAVVKDGIAKAKAAGIPVVANLVGPKADAVNLPDPERGGKVMADYLVTASNAKANILVLNSGEFPFTVDQFKAMGTELAAVCPSCQSKTVDFTFATMPTKLAGQVASALQANPSIDYVITPFDAAVTFVRQGVRQAGRPTKIASFAGDPPTMETLGDGTFVADVAAPNTWTGWQSVDSLARLMLDQPVLDAPMPQRLFTTENKEAALDWDGDVDFRSQYAKIWGKR